MDPVQRSATYDDVLAAPEHLVAEIVGGTLYTNPRPASRHAHAASTLGMDLGSPFHRGRMPAVPDTVWFGLAPDWIGEVVSSSTGRLDRTAKMPAHADSERVRAEPFAAVELELGALWLSAGNAC